MSDRPLSATIAGAEKVVDSVGYEIEHIEGDSGETPLVRVTFDLWQLEIFVTFSIDDAEEFLVAFRDEIVRAKQEKLEQKTNTDPETNGTEEEDTGE